MVIPIWTDGSIEAAFLIIVILVLRKLCKKLINPNIRYFFWGIVALRVLIPIHLILVLPNTAFTDWINQQSAPVFAWINDLIIVDDTMQDVPVSQGQEMDAQEGIINLPLELGVTYQAQNLPLEPGDNYGADNLPLVSGEQGSVIPAEGKKAGATEIMFQVIWLVGALAMTVYMLVKNITFYQRVKAERRLVTKLDNGLWLYEVTGLNCLMGIIRPAIYMSPEVLQDARLKEHVQTHELQHYRVRDNVWVLVRGLCLIVQWYNPLVWVAYVESGKDCELACDYRVTKGMKHPERVAYGESLLAVISLGCKKQTHLATSMGEDKEFFAERLKDIMKEKRRKMILLPCLLLLFIFVLVFSSVTYEKKEAEKQEIDSKTEADTTSQDEAVRQQQIEAAEAEKQKEQELVEAQKQAEKRMIHMFTQEDVVVTPEVPMYTYEEAVTLTTAAEYRDFLPGASEGTWYVMEIDGIEYFYARYDFKAEEQPGLCGAGYVIVGDNYALANGLKVGMTEEEVLALYPNMAVMDFEGKPVYEEVTGANIWNLGHYPQSEAWLENGIDYQWTDQFDYVMMGLIDQGDNKLPLYVGLMVKDKVVKAISFHSPTAG